MAQITSNNVRFMVRNDTAARWAVSNLILMKGEIALESDTGKFKFGDGVHKFNEITKYAGVITEASLQNGYIKVDGEEVQVYELPNATTGALGGIKAADTIAGGGYDVGAVQVDSSTGVASVASVGEALKLATSRTISITGDASGYASFDGSSDTTISITLASTGVNTLDSAKDYVSVKVNGKGQVTDGSETITLSKISDAGTAASLNGGTSAGNVPVLDSNGKLVTDVLPSLAIGDTEVVADTDTMIALTTTQVQKGDVCIVTGENKTFRLVGNDPSNINNWKQILTPDAPVQSVNGKTGNVILSTTDISEGTNLYYTDTRFDGRFSVSSSTSLSDGAHILHDTDVLIFDGGDASVSGGSE